MEILRIEHPAKSYRKEKMLYKHSLTKKYNQAITLDEVIRR